MPATHAIHNNAAERDPAAARPGLPDLNVSTDGTTRSDADPGLQPDHPDRAGAGVYRGAASILSATAVLGRRFVLPVPGRWRRQLSVLLASQRSARGHGRPHDRGEPRSIPNTHSPNSPTSWFWNIRVGDKIQINNAGPWYTVVGPMTSNAGRWQFRDVRQRRPARDPIASRRALHANGTQTIVYYPEFLFLVNGQDDNNNGWTDEGWDGVDNNGNGHGRRAGRMGTRDCGPSPIVDPGVSTNQPYTIQRRPAPAANAREVALPTQVVIDLTTWNTDARAVAASRAVINRYTGYVDILVNPDGTVVPTTIYSTPASFGLSGAFLHFWLARAERPGRATTSSTTLRPTCPCRRAWRRRGSTAWSSRASIAWSRSSPGPARSRPTRTCRSITRPRRRTGLLTTRTCHSRQAAGCPLDSPPRWRMVDGERVQGSATGCPLERSLTRRIQLGLKLANINPIGPAWGEPLTGPRRPSGTTCMCPCATNREPL